MDKQEFQDRINDLENSLHAKQAEIEQLITEKSALKLRGMTHLSGQVKELSIMSQELQASQAKLNESRQDLERIPLLEEMLASEQEKIRQLAVENATLRQETTNKYDALQNEDEVANLKEQLQNLKEKLMAADEERLALKESIADKMSLTAQTEKVNNLVVKLEQELTLSREECYSLKSEIKIIKDTATDRDNLEYELATAQERNMELAKQLRGLTQIQTELAATETELDMARQKIASLNARNERVSVLEDLLLTRQVEVTGLTNEMNEFRSRVTEQHNEELSPLHNRIEELQNDLLTGKTKQRQDDSLIETQITEELPIVPDAAPAITDATNIKPEKRDNDTYNVDNKEISSKSSPYLPNDVLKKWLAQG